MDRGPRGGLLEERTVAYSLSVLSAPCSLVDCRAPDNAQCGTHSGDGAVTRLPSKSYIVVLHPKATRQHPSVLKIRLGISLR